MRNLAEKINRILKEALNLEEEKAYKKVMVATELEP